VTEDEKPATPASGGGSVSKRDWQKAQDAIDTLVRMQIAQGLAPLFMDRKRPYEENARLAAMVEDRLLHKAAFIQKPPPLLRFYKRLLFAMEQEPRSILEIGVKGGGSTALWKALFPAATVVGMDIDLRRWLASGASEDGVIYVQGDQSDVPKLEAIARDYGPFSIVIDDGSHVSDHQVATLRCLLPHVRSGGLYVIEDVHATLKSVDETHEVDYGDDIWADFVLSWFQQRRKGPAGTSTPGARLAQEVAPLSDDLIVSRHVLAIRVR
jgi:cephalosporin hydroxylase